MSETRTEERLGKLETEFAIVRNDLGALGRSLMEFRDEWSNKAEEDRKAHRAARLTFPQIMAMLAGAVSMTAVLLGGLMYLINVSGSSVRSDLTSQIGSAKQSAEAANAQTGLTVRGMVEGITALNTGMQTLQREQALDRVKLGLVEQQAKANTAFIDKAQSFDAFMAGHDERLKALEQTVRDIAARRPPS
ncbi:hypothetical protein [Bosea sp. (in: a-proteobacteria)]|uniref:hypothetical protein n=1 Tax=Bosea sp. (in: a-proteobacteria) TaxID=1871050 RepID=UPI003B3AB7BF